MNKGGKIVLVAIAVISVVMLLVSEMSKTMELQKYHVNYDDHLTYYTDESGHEVRAYPNESHDPDTCPICRVRRAQLERDDQLIR